jgi:outer membrane protein
MRRLPLFLWTLALLPAMAAAREPLSLQSAMQRAREHSREVTAAQLRAQAAGEQLRRARDSRWPTVTLEETYIRTDSPAEVFALTLNQERFSLQQLMSSDPNRPEALDTAVTRLELAVPLYTGGELSGRIAQAASFAEAATRSASWAADTAALQAAQAYVALAQASEYASLLERARDTVAGHVALARAYVEQGMLVRSELLRAEVELSRVEDLLAEARGRVEVASANLSFRLGADQGLQWDLKPLGDPPAVTGDVGEWLAAASTRPDVAAARAMQRAGALEEQVRRAALRPRVALVARSDWVDDTLFGSHGDSTSLVAVARWRVLDAGADRAAARAARLEAEAAAEDVERFAEGVALEVRQAFEEARTEWQRHRTAQRALEAAVESERITRERFASGVVKMLDLLDASTARREAETRELVARARAIEAALRLAVASGKPPEAVLQ